ncbi:uncharacterized protein JN550_011110 [Neoarthrinium moseri]|uniref:uncharacterized protein n=1 Tax=Neoarthrinium moseri TaxID=1658444 RepID=UPI001FDB58DE|nr:uncharacterized protein JN550_011110 [Neoarthrinium moseri]KAI1860955.1 hypothetical protein JN550_011110 [Neoarthrinium moseri]
MSGIELLGFACNIMQVISFSREVISLCSNVYQGKHPDAELAKLATSLQVVSSGVQTHFDTMQPRTADEKRLCDIATRCAIAARDLDEEVGFITSRHKQGNLASTLRIAAQTAWRKRRLDRLEKSLTEHERVLDTHLMARVCKQTDAIGLRQQEGFDKLGADIQHFVSQYAIGHKKLRELVKSDMSLSQKRSEKVMKTHVTKEITTSKIALVNHIDSQAEITTKTITRHFRDLNARGKDDSREEQFLRSFKYPAMNERRNYLTESHEGTFKWVFSQDKPSNDEDRRTDYQDPPWDNFEDWLRSDSDIYWICGKPGSGKSTLMKFLASNTLTKEALRAWRHQVVIISHFFWKPGSANQRNVKGLFASLLHQLLTLRQDLLQAILENSSDLGQKDSDADWSVTELRSLCLSTMRNYPSSICIFLDGLDEICDEEGSGSLMEILDTMKAIPSVKICVASRPEKRFECHLSRFPHLKLQGLTSKDIRHYADRTLRPFWSRRQDLSVSVLDKEILPVLSEKAQGVFLWIRLAVKNLMSGLENSDSDEDLILRLHDLPTEISRMYYEMWARLNKNTKVYRESTAKYLNLLIAHRELEDYASKQGYSNKPARVLEIMGATNLSLQSRLFTTGQVPAAEVINDQYDRTRELIDMRCVGLVDTTPLWKARSIPRNNHPEECLKPSLIPDLSLRATFIHRTAYDFLVDTEEGHHIRAYDSSSVGERYLQVVRGQLVAAVISQNESLCSLLPKIAFTSRFVPQRMTYDFLKVCWKLHNRTSIRFDFLPRPDEPRPDDTRPHFLTALTCPEFKDFISVSIKKSPRPSALATELLRDMLLRDMLLRDMRDMLRPIMFNQSSFFYFNPLISLGADPKLRGPSYQMNAGPLNGDGVFLYSVTPFQLLLQIELKHSLFNRVNKPLENPTRVEVPVELLQLFKDKDSALNEPLWMSLSISPHICNIAPHEGYWGRLARFEEGPNETMDPECLQETRMIVEMKTSSVLEDLCRRHRAYYGRARSSALVTCLEEPAQYISCINIRYLEFTEFVGGHIMSYRVRVRESTQDIEPLIASWLYGEIEEYPSETVWGAVKRLYCDFAAGSTRYERVYGDVRANLADEGLGFCRVTKEEAKERAQHMRDEDIEAPGHWL